MFMKQNYAIVVRLTRKRWNTNATVYLFKIFINLFFLLFSLLFLLLYPVFQFSFNPLLFLQQILPLLNHLTFQTQPKHIRIQYPNPTLNISEYSIQTQPEHIRIKYSNPTNKGSEKTFKKLYLFQITLQPQRLQELLVKFRREGLIVNALNNFQYFAKLSKFSWKTVFCPQETNIISL